MPSTAQRPELVTRGPRSLRCGKGNFAAGGASQATILSTFANTLKRSQVPEMRFKLLVSCEQEPSLIFRPADRGVTHPYFGHRLQICRQVQVDVEAGIDRT